MIKLTRSSTETMVRPPHKFYAAVGVMVAIIVIYELLFLIQIPTDIIQLTLGLVLLVGVVFSAYRYGLWPSVTAATIANLYLIYALSGPGRDIVPIQNILRGEWLIALLFYGPAMIIGYLSDRVNFLIQRERQARSQAEEDRMQLTTILEQMPVGVAIAKAPSGQLVFSNNHLDQLMGHSVEKDETAEDYPHNVLVDDHGHPIPQSAWPIARIVKNNETLVNEEYLYQADSNTRLTLQVKGAPIVNPAGDITSGVVIIDDITAEKELVQRKDDFLSMVSHELKTPITSLTMYTQLLMKQLKSNPNYNPVSELQKIDDQTKKLNRIINNMLDLATIQLNKQPYHFEPVNISAILSEVTQELKNTHQARDIVIQEQSRTTILADRDRLTQVVTNLITNAIKYSPENTPVIITSERKEGHMQLSVQDFGIGITPRERKKIFERFYQESQKDGKIYPGLGIGLYFSAEIVKQHHGKIWVESKKGHGSTFYVALPLAKASRKSQYTARL